MKHYLQFLSFFLILRSAQCTELIHKIYKEINIFRNDSFQYIRDHPEIKVACQNQNSLNNLTVNKQLEEASNFQATTLSTNECSQINHLTCPKYCFMFGSCSHVDRVKYYLDQNVKLKVKDIEEILIGYVNNFTIIMKAFLSSSMHCNHILNPTYQFIGGSCQNLDKKVCVIDFMSWSV
jgi:hypothetical protein